MSKNLKLLAITFFVLFVLVEVVLRIFFHIQPGRKFYSPYFKEVDTLIIKHGYEADSNGIQKIEALTARAISERIEIYHQTGNYISPADTESDNVYNMPGYVFELELPDFRNALKAHIQTAGFPSTDLDSAIQYYLYHPVNDQGFRSIPFKQYHSGKKKVLLLGDSFTWGHSASNVFNSFADNLLAKGYAVYNTGITCTDPVQYEQVALQYVPLLQPDFVVMNMYLGNDVHYFSRQSIPYGLQMIPTNSDNLVPIFCGVSVADADSAYRIIADNMNIPSDSSLFNKFCSLTATGTLVWRVFARLGWVKLHGREFADIWKKGEEMRIPKPDVNARAKNIQLLCDKYNATLLVSAIPSVTQFIQLDHPKDYSGLFDSVPYFLSPVGISGYNKAQDGHFNDEGHKAYADFLHHVMDSISNAKHP